MSRPVAPSIASFVLALTGLGLSIYLTIEHYSTTKHFACPQNAVLNCLKVTTSQWSVLFGVPVAVLGLLYYVAMTVLTVPVAAMERFSAVRTALAVTGPAMVVYLVYVELFKVDAICLWCTAVHVVTIAMVTTILWHNEALKRHLHREHVDAA